MINYHFTIRCFAVECNHKYNGFYRCAKPMMWKSEKSNVLTDLLIKFYEIVYVMVYYDVLEDLLCNVFV